MCASVRTQDQKWERTGSSISRCSVAVLRNRALLRKIVCQLAVRDGAACPTGKAIVFVMLAFLE